ncbi:hypothetical protein TSUD_355170 [Trifolium subterraneum]|uniref:ER lumen protein-retaining receptor n=1 Tax=Trifolium subterraneum TaxID=3900 RepID=A0A2Z6MG57_TRISU|nr:hypothetical protein TSUD_355170 [Trifolium subterraneum]
MGSKKDLAVNYLTRWLGKRSMKMKIFLGILLAFCAIVILKYTITEPHFYYIASGSIHIAGLVTLVYKLFVYKTCSGMFIPQVPRAQCCIPSIKIRLKSSYIKEFDNMWLSFLVVPSAILAVLIQPRSPQYYWIARVIFAFTLYLETVAILPQIRYMQNAKV